MREQGIQERIRGTRAGIGRHILIKNYFFYIYIMQYLEKQADKIYDDYYITIRNRFGLSIMWDADECYEIKRGTDYNHNADTTELIECLEKTNIPRDNYSIIFEYLGSGKIVTEKTKEFAKKYNIINSRMLYDEYKGYFDLDKLSEDYTLEKRGNVYWIDHKKEDIKIFELNEKGDVIRELKISTYKEEQLHNKLLKMMFKFRAGIYKHLNGDITTIKKTGDEKFSVQHLTYI